MPRAAAQFLAPMLAPMLARTLALTLALLAGGAAAQEDAGALPEPVASAAPEIRRETAEAFGLCLRAGGTPGVTPDYLRVADLNGDGAPDYVIDLGGLVCDGALTLFCGPSGCPVMVWLSGPAGLGRVWGGFAEAARIEAGALVVRRVEDCPPGTGGEGCEERLDFAGVLPSAEAAREGGTGPGPRPRPAAAGAPAAAEVPAEPVGDWTLRAVPEGEPVAVTAGPGRIEEVAVFCLSGAGFVALTLAPRPDAEAVSLGFDFSQGAVAAEARFEEGAGGAYVVALGAAGPLAARLAGRDSAVPVAIDGRAEGVLSLAGSTRAIRGALAPCGGP